MFDTAPTSLQDLRQQQHTRHASNVKLYYFDLFTRTLELGDYRLQSFTTITDPTGHAAVCVLAHDPTGNAVHMVPDRNGWSVWHNDQRTPLPTAQARRLQRLAQAQMLRQPYWSQLQTLPADRQDACAQLLQPQWQGLRQRVARMRLQFMLSDGEQRNAALRCLCVEAENEARWIDAERVLGAALWDWSQFATLQRQLEQEPERIAQAQKLQPQLPLHSLSSQHCHVRELQRRFKSIDVANCARSILKEIFA